MPPIVTIDKAIREINMYLVSTITQAAKDFQTDSKHRYEPGVISKIAADLTALKALRQEVTSITRY